SIRRYGLDGRLQRFIETELPESPQPMLIDPLSLVEVDGRIRLSRIATTTFDQAKGMWVVAKREYFEVVP
ncbi:MAG TPA: hypothetical protein VF386_10930, partial [Usitatibacter sp.]